MIATERRPHTADRRAAIAHGAYNSARSRAARDRYLIVLRVLARLGFAGLFDGLEVRDAELAETVGAIAAAKDPHTPEGMALHAVSAGDPTCLAKWIRRNRPVARAVTVPYDG